MLYIWISVDNFQKIKFIEEGSYGIVSKYKDKETGELVALKKVKMMNEITADGFPTVALRETNILLDLEHPNIVCMYK